MTMTPTSVDGGKKADKKRISRLFGRNQVKRKPVLSKQKNPSSTFGTRWPDLFQEDLFVVLMGPTGTGKSTFVEIAAGIQGIAGHTLESQTTEISSFKYPFPAFGSSEFFLVDTPGFNDTKESDINTIKMMSNWLCNTYKRRHRVVGLLYFHRISDNRIDAAALQNLVLFNSFCEEQFDGQIVLTTTMWDEVDEETGASREQGLKDRYWKPLIDSGASVQRFRRDNQSAREILAPIIEDINEDRLLFLRNKIETLGVELNRTAVGRLLRKQLDDSVSLLQEILVEHRNQSLQLLVDPEQLQLLTDQFQDASVQLQHTMRDAIKRTLPPTRPRRVIKQARWTQQFGKVFIKSKRAQKPRPPNREIVSPSLPSLDNWVMTPASGQDESFENLSLQESRAASPTDAQVSSGAASLVNLPPSEHRPSQSTQVPGPRRSKGVRGWNSQLRRLPTPLLDQRTRSTDPSTLLSPTPTNQEAGGPPRTEQEDALRSIPGPRRSQAREGWVLLMKRLQIPRLDGMGHHIQVEQQRPELGVIPGPRRSKGIAAWGIQLKRIQNSQPSPDHPRHDQQTNDRPNVGQAGSSQPSQLVRTRSLPVQFNASPRPIHDNVPRLSVEDMPPPPPPKEENCGKQTNGGPKDFLIDIGI